MRAKYINEKFEEKSDPVMDMGIGEYPVKIVKLREKLRDMFDENYSKVVDDEENNQEAWIKIDVIQDIQEELNKLFGAEQ
jgi:hypothetical protein